MKYTLNAREAGTAILGGLVRNGTIPNEPGTAYEVVFRTDSNGDIFVDVEKSVK